MRQIRGQRVVAIVLVVAFALIAAASASADPRYTVMNAEGGIYWRSEPNWNAAEATSGFGVYNGTTIEVHCYQSGTTVPGSADTMWEQATDVAGSGYGSGWVNEHFINDGQPINQPSPGVPACNAPPPPPPPPPAGLVFSVFNAEGGIYYRNSPHWADTPATPGVGVYNGDQVELICGALGDPVGPYNDTAWSYVNNLSRSVGDGWVNEHFINDGALTNQFVAGEPMCGSDIPGATGGGSSGGGGSGSSGDGSFSPPPMTEPEPPSVFYSPNGVATGLPRVPQVSTHDRTTSAWATGDACSDSRVLSATPSGTAILAGWSAGRLGPIYFLAAATSPRLAQVHDIILFDPGDTADFAKPSTAKVIKDRLLGRDPTTCDWRYPINSLLASWLKMNPSNHLTIFTGKDSEEQSGGRPYAGLWSYYLAGIWKKPFASRAQICDYHNMGHEEVLEHYAWVVKDPPPGCPAAPSASHKLTAWNP